jgi:hypothetical protein
MTPKTAALLTDPHPQCHIVFPYSDDTHITEAVSLFAGAGLSNEEAVILVTTDEHRRAVEQRLAAEGYDVAFLERERRLTIIDAEDLLCEFHRDNVPDAAIFTATISRIIEDARQHSPSGKVRVYGEMVNLLCGHNSIEAAEQLENLWNEAIDVHHIPLLCSYSLDVLRPTAGGMPESLLAAHTHTVSHTS